jgi:intein/homing endonuclease
VVEFQQSKEGPDYQSLTKAPVVHATDQEVAMATAIRFSPEQVVHARLGDDRRTFYPYGVSIVEPARGPANQLRLMEDSMLVYRLCLEKNTRIRTNNGYKYISDIKIGDKVFSYTHGNVFENTVTNTMRHQPKDIWEAKSKHLSIKGTQDHPILVLRNGKEQYIEIQNLKIKSDKFISTTHESNIPKKIETIFGEPWAKLSLQQRVLFRQKKYTNISEKIRNFQNPERVKQFLYCEGKSLPLTQAKEIVIEFNLNSENLAILNKSEVNAERLDLPEFVTPEFARLFGFMYGDGNVHKNGINFAAGTDNKINEFYNNLLIKFFGKTSFSPEKRSKVGVGKYNVNSVTVSKIFKSLGYTGTHRDIRVPDWLFNASKEIRKEFVLGLCDADGTIRHTYKGTWFCTLELCNKNLIEDVKELWQSIGLSSGKLSTRTRKENRLVCGNLIKETTGHLITLTQIPQNKYENVISVSKVGEDFVYDISVEGDVQNFIANGMPVHNSRSPERRVFYIDVGQLPPHKAEAFVERMKSQFRKKKISSNRPGVQGANSVEERYHAPAVDEDYWLPVRPNANTRIETLPGAQNLGEIDDAIYFRNRLFTALQFPKNYMNNEDPNVTKITLSAQDIRVARLIERLQAPMEDIFWEIADRHLKLRGFPEETYEDLNIKMTQSSEWRELSRAEVTNARIQNASSLKSGQLLSDYDILTKWMAYGEEETKILIARLKMQKIEDAKLQVLAQNPALLGVGIPSSDEKSSQNTLGTTPEGPNQEITPEGLPPPESTGDTSSMPDLSGGGEASANQTQSSGGEQGSLKQPSPQDIIKYDLQIQNYASEEDYEPYDDNDY